MLKKLCSFQKLHKILCYARNMDFSSIIMLLCLVCNHRYSLVCCPKWYSLFEFWLGNIAKCWRYSDHINQMVYRTMNLWWSYIRAWWIDRDHTSKQSRCSRKLLSPFVQTHPPAVPLPVPRTSRFSLPLHSFKLSPFMFVSCWLKFSSVTSNF